MNFSIRNFVLAPVVLAAAALTANASTAATTLKVPFSFTVAGKDCPAGVYTVQHDTMRNLVTLSNKNSAQSFTWVLGPGAPSPNDISVVLKFDDLGESHALKFVQYGASTTRDLDSAGRHSEHRVTEIMPGQ